MARATIYIKYPVNSLRNGDVLDYARMDSMSERWRTNAYQWEKTIHIERKEAKKIYIGPRIIQAAVELSFRRPGASIYINENNEEDLKPMTAKKSRSRSCVVCHDKPMRGKEMCKECSEMSAGAQRIVMSIQPVVNINVDTRYRWISGSITLSMDG